MLDYCNIIITPSLINNLPLIGIELESCGLLILTFSRNVVEDLALHKHNGCLEKHYNVKDLVKDIA